MGVDIWFSAEVRKKDKWQPLIWYRKYLGEKYESSYTKQDANGMVVNYSIWGGRAYHYNDALGDLTEIYNYPEDMSEELKALLPNDIHVGKGYFSYSTLVRYMNNAEKKMLANLLESRDYQLVKHVHRIEKAVTGKPVKDKISTSYISEYSIKQIYDEYMEEMWKLIELRNIIYYLADEFDSFSSSDDIRIIYHLC